jgi:aspartate racemase
MANEKVVIIGGGVGPMAGVALHAKIIENTRTDGTDQSHLEIFHYSCSSLIPDRTEYLLGRVESNPALGMAEVFSRAWASLADTGKMAVGGVPCNTFHAPAVFEPFLSRLRAAGIGIPIVHMLEETRELLYRIVPGGGRIGVLSTTGTRNTRVYRDLLEQAGYRVLEIPEARQDDLQNAIYHREWGIKARSPVTETARSLVLELAGLLIRDGADAVVLGCTELPLALPERTLDGIPLADPVLALARALIREAAPEKLKCL